MRLISGIDTPADITLTMHFAVISNHCFEALLGVVFITRLEFFLFQQWLAQTVRHSTPCLVVKVERVRQRSPDLEVTYCYTVSIHFCHLLIRDPFPL